MNHFREIFTSEELHTCVQFNFNYVKKGFVWSFGTELRDVWEIIKQTSLCATTYKHVCVQ